MQDHDAAYHEQYEAAHNGASCPDCVEDEVIDMDNDQAIASVETLIYQTELVQRLAIETAVYLQQGGEPTWDSIKSLAGAAEVLRGYCETVETFRNDDVFQAIIPL